MVYEEKRKEIAFNIGLFQAQFVAEIYRGIFTDYLKGDLTGWFWHLKTMREIINSDLQSTESTEMDNTEKKITEMFNDLRRVKSKAEYIKKKNEYTEFVTLKYQREVLRYMKVAGYMPTKKDKARLGF